MIVQISEELRFEAELSERFEAKLEVLIIFFFRFLNRERI